MPKIEKESGNDTHEPATIPIQPTLPMQGNLPPLNQQLPLPASSEVLRRIRPVQQRPRQGIRLVVYGESKTGKTRLAASFPKPMLLIGTEDGTKSIEDVDGIDFVEIGHTEELEHLIPVLQRKKYASVGLDTAGGLQWFAAREHLKLAEVPVARRYGMVKRQDWNAIGNLTKEAIASILRLSKLPYCLDLCIIAHERNFNDEEGEAEIARVSKGPALIPTVVNWLTAECDYVTQTSVRKEKETVKIEIEGSEPILQEQYTGRDIYCLRLRRNSIYSAGFRMPESRDSELPEFMVDATYTKILSLINGPPKPEPVSIPTKPEARSESANKRKTPK